MLPLALEAGTALWVDAAGTLLHPAQPVAEVYAEAAHGHGHRVTASQVRERFGPAMERHAGIRRSEPSWRAYWQAVVSDVLGTDAPFEALYQYYARGEAWRVAPGARDCLMQLRTRGVRTALISNWDDRLRGTLEELDLIDAFDAILVSGEEGIEKPDPAIFRRAAKRLSIPANQSLMVGDSLKSDIDGARSVGAFVIQFGTEIKEFRSIMDS